MGCENPLPSERARSARHPYIVFYADEVLILRVRHTSQDPAHHLDD
jgi:plasmid stabilization system protein ParE